MTKTTKRRESAFEAGSGNDAADPRARYRAVEDACWLYRDQDLERNLRRFGWRRARREVLRNAGREWVARGGGREMRLGRKGLEVRFSHTTGSIGWRELRAFILARRY